MEYKDITVTELISWLLCTQNKLPDVNPHSAFIYGHCLISEDIPFLMRNRLLTQSEADASCERGEGSTTVSEEANREIDRALRRLGKEFGREDEIELFITAAGL